MVEIKIHERVVEERHAVKVETIFLGKDRNLFRYREDITRTGAKPKLKTFQGVATDRQLIDLRAGRETKFNRFYAFTDEQIEGLRRFGYAYLSNDHFKAIEGKSPEALIAQAPFDFIAGGGSVHNLVRFEHYDHSFWKADGSIFPYAISFDYIGSGIDNRNYDLPKLVEILSKRDDVTIVPARERYRFVRGRADRRGALVAAEPGEEIDDIPYYNRDGGRRETVNFYFTPTVKQHTDMREAGLSGSFDRYRYIFDNDLLGLRAGGAALFGDFYGRTLPDGSPAPERNYESDDDDGDD